PRACRGAVQELEPLASALHCTGREIWLCSGRRAPPYPPFKAQHILAADPLGNGKAFSLAWIEYRLDNPFSVPQVNEDHTPVIPAAVYPAAQLDLLIQMGGVQISTVVAAHVDLSLKGEPISI